MSDLNDKSYQLRFILDEFEKSIHGDKKNNLLAVNKELFHWIDEIKVYNAQIQALHKSNHNVLNTQIFTTIYDKLITNIDVLSKENNHTAYLSSVISNIQRGTTELTESFDFFAQLDFLNTNIVLIGANGSGKTTLSERLKEIISERAGVIIGAQKILIIPQFTNITLSNEITESKLAETYGFSKSSKVTFQTDKSDSLPYDYVVKHGNIFRRLIENLLSNHNSFVHSRDRRAKAGEIVDYGMKSNLEKTLEIWNGLLESRTLKCDDGVNLVLDGKDVPNPYPAYMMSDGEKVALYYITQVLQAPEKGLIVIDEPEMYLHKTILHKLWNRLEIERSDCQFIYLTHDLEFASSRIGANKFWVKAFIYPQKWEIKPLPENEIPEEMLLELVGSRKRILFCEGKSTSSFDKQIYEVLFSNYTLKTVETCTNVITYTKAYNKVGDFETEAFGIIDADHRSDTQLNKLKDDNIYGLALAEIENLLLSEKFLINLAPEIMCSKKEVDLIKEEVIKKLTEDIELQSANYVSSKINLYFAESHVSKGNKKADVVGNFQEFTDKVKIEEWYSDRIEFLQKIIDAKDYDAIIKVYNNKGLAAIVNKHFKISNFTERAIKHLSQSKEAQEILKGYFPSALFK